MLLYVNDKKMYVLVYDKQTKCQCNLNQTQRAKKIACLRKNQTVASGKSNYIRNVTIFNIILQENLNLSEQ